MLIKLCFIIAGILWSIELIPQLIKTYKSKKVEDISLLFPVICATAFIFFFTGTLLDKQWILFLSQFLPFVNLIILIGLILRYRRKK